jgi:hypothetical protein
MAYSAYVCLLAPVQAGAQTEPGSGIAVYQQLKKFELSGGTVAVEKLVLKRDRAEIEFVGGKFYFEGPVAGRVCSAVFVGQGKFRAQVPSSSFEQEHVRRMLKADIVESDFETAVLRFTDDTFDLIGKGFSSGTAPSNAMELAREFEPRFLKETGANLSARLALSILNREDPGFFVAQFDKGKRGRFTLLMDHQGRIPTATFDINAGEKGLIIAYRSSLGGNDVWMAFYSEQDYIRRKVSYSNAYDLVDTTHYKMEVDAREPRKRLIVQARIDMEVLAAGIRAIPFSLSESLSDYESQRLKRAMRIKSASLTGGSALESVQEDWEGGLTLYLPKEMAQGEKLSVSVVLEGDFMFDSSDIPHCFYPLDSSAWYPRHGYLDRGTFDITFRHQKPYLVAGTGRRVHEGIVDKNEKERITQWKIEEPVALVTFGVGHFERHEETATQGDQRVPIEFYSLPGSSMAIKEDFMIAEMMNSLNYFTVLFGKYPYSKFGAVFHPRGFGQGFASLLLLPRSDRANKHTYSFIAHETAHQWWGNIVAWRSYRDQWLSEGFAEYSGILYTNLRDKPKAGRELIEEMRASLKDPPETETGIGKGRLADVGPIVLGHRLSTRETSGAYQALIYNKGGLVLRMLHFLFSDPATGKGDAFFDMMRDFVKRHSGGWATSESFLQVANEHFVKTPLARKFQLQDLNWFFRQWVEQAHLPSYRMMYSLEDQTDGSVLLKGTIQQENAPKDWFMPLPLMIQFDQNRSGLAGVHAYGPQTPFQIKLPMRPKKVELDPHLWIASEKTVTEQGK